MKQELIVHTAICKYIAMQYPGVIFTTESSGLRLSIGMARIISKLRSCDSLPDLWIMEPKQNNDLSIFCGLFIEVKATPEDYLTKNGKLRTGEHIQNQAKILSLLREKGYAAHFAGGFDEGKKIIDEYMGLEGVLIIAANGKRLCAVPTNLHKT